MSIELHVSEREDGKTRERLHTWTHSGAVTGIALKRVFCKATGWAAKDITSPTDDEWLDVEHVEFYKKSKPYEFVGALWL